MERSRNRHSGQHLEYGRDSAAVAFGRYEVAIVLAALNLLTMEGLVPWKKYLDREEKEERAEENRAGIPKHD